MGAGGCALRALYVFALHPAPRHIYSDMEGYVGWALRILGPQPETIADTIHPTGMPLYLALGHALDPSWGLTLWLQWLVCCAQLALVFALGRRLFGVRTALVALGMAAAYFPLIHYAGLFLAENPFTTLCLVALWATCRGLAAGGGRAAGGWGLTAGLAAGLAATFKNAVLGPVVFTGAALAVVMGRRRWRPGLALGAAAAVGLAALYVPMSLRCTRLNDGVFCLGATNIAMNVLMGHCGRKGMFYWHDHVHHTEFGFQSPTTVLRGYTTPVHLDFAAFDAASNLRVARAYVAAHPWEALRLSLDNVADLVAMPTLWPRAELAGVDLGAWSQRGFWALVLLPAALHLARLGWRRRPLPLPELICTAPLVGLAVTVFLSVSEARYRVPFDPLLLLLAARLYASGSDGGAAAAERGRA